MRERREFASNRGLDDLGVDLVPDIRLAFDGNHVVQAGTLWDNDGWSKVIRVPILVGDVLDE